MRNGISWKIPLLTAMFLLISIPMFMDLQPVRAQNDIDVSGIWRFKGENKFHIEFAKKESQLIATFVYDDKELKGQYGERLPFFTATLN
ncbi:MAG: hypothetical protein PHC68_17680, partial [Syntrophorhabdaceae bacterium]|nr:hypothetical protein [Syntrophorhabdaceae bacterium]